MGADYFFCVAKAKDIFKLKYLLRLKSISFEDSNSKHYSPPRSIAHAPVYALIDKTLHKFKIKSWIKLPECTTMMSLKGLPFDEVYKNIKADPDRYCETELEATKHLLTWLKKKCKEGYDVLLTTVSY